MTEISLTGTQIIKPNKQTKIATSADPDEMSHFIMVFTFYWYPELKGLRVNNEVVLFRSVEL